MITRDDQRDEMAMLRDEAAEMAVVGAVLLNPEMFDVVCSEGLRPHDFSSGVARELWISCMNVVSEELPIDIIPVRKDLERRGKLDFVGGWTALSNVIEQSPSAGMGGHYARIVVERSKARALYLGMLESAAQLRAGAAVSEASATAGKALERAVEMDDGRADAGWLKDLLKRDVGMTKVNAHSWGFPSLDKHTDGIPEGALTVIGAYPSTGKTALSTTVAMRLARASTPVPTAFFTIEMSNAQIVQTIIARETGIPLGKLRAVGASNLGERDAARFIEVIPGMEVPLYLDPRPASSTDIAARARVLQRRSGVKVIFIDYLQLLSGNTRDVNRRLEIDGHVRTLKALAKATGLSVVLLSQMTRPQSAYGKKGDTSQNDNPRPSVGSLKESGSINEVADLICLLWRPRFRQFDACPECAGTSGNRCATCRGEGRVSIDNELDVIVGKNRFGEAGYAVALDWNGRLMQINSKSEVGR